MLEQAMRAESVHIQMQCYAVCLNTLMLVEPNYAWIVKPTDNQEVLLILLVKSISSSAAQGLFRTIAK